MAKCSVAGPGHYVCLRCVQGIVKTDPAKVFRCPVAACRGTLDYAKVVGLVQPAALRHKVEHA